MRHVPCLLLILLLALARPAAADTWAFVHRATDGNTAPGGVSTTLDHPELNGHPDRIVLVTPRWIPHRYELGEVARPFAVAYDRAAARWRVARVGTDSAILPPAEFNVVAMPTSAEAWVHTIGSAGDRSLLDRPIARDRRNLVFATPEATTGAPVDDHPIGVLYDEVAGAWTLVHRDGAPFVPGLRFHVWVVARGLEIEGISRATADGEAPVTVGAPGGDSVVLTAANWSPDGVLAPASRGFEAVTWDGSRWLIRGREMPVGSAYNSVVLRASRLGDEPLRPVPPVATAPPEPTRLRVRAVDQRGAPVSGAEVFLDGSPQPGRTSRTGELVLTLPAGTPVRGRELIARHLLRENESWLRRHAGGSVNGGNWSHHVWRWNYDPVAGRGTAVGNPAEVQVVRMDRTLIGLHLVVSMEWDANRSNWEWLRGELQGASNLLFHATDGQFYLERLEVGDNRHEWDDYVADLRIWTDYTMRAIVRHRAGGMIIRWEGNYAPANLARSDDRATIVHELGHYAFGMVDEYQDAYPEAGCTARLHNPGTPFAKWAPAASCLMYDQSVAGKFCSHHAANRHHMPGRENRWHWLGQVEPCWNTIQHMFEKPGGELISPDERTTIPGAVQRPDFVTATIVETNTDMPGLVEDVQPFRLPDRGVPVWVEHRHGPHTFQGRTLTARRPDERGWFGTTTDPSMDRALWLAGLHVGDRIVWGDLASNSRVVTATGFSPVEPGRPPAYAGSVAAEIPQDGSLVDPGRKDAPFDLFVTLEPTGQGNYQLVLETSAAPSAVPKVSLSPTKVPGKALTLARNGELFLGSVLASAQGQTLLLKAEAVVGGEKVERFIPVAVSPLTSKWESASYSGDLSLVVNAKDGSFVAITPGDVDAPDPARYRTVSGPFRVAVSGGGPVADGPLPGPGWLRFRLPDGGAPPDAAGMRILRYDRAKKGWQDLGGTWLPPVAVFSTQVESEGNYALVFPIARPGTGVPALKPDRPADSASVAPAWMSSVLPNGAGAVRLVAGGAPTSIVVEDLQGQVVAELRPALEGPPEKPDQVAYANGLVPGATYRARVRTSDGSLGEPLEFRVEDAPPGAPQPMVEDAPPKTPAAPQSELRILSVQPAGGGAATLEGQAALPAGGEVVFLVFGPQGEWVTTSETLRVPVGGSSVTASVEGLQPGVAYSVLLVTVDRSAESAPFPVLLDK